ncbi:helix-turn-helix domain-containing protein [Escherichia coli]|uniref:helix-turn-helix domain-containing protein n=1 Tax=Escherichia coli TaxID=562 RepID=UPI000BCD4C8D|nr:helix-turn-helix domain-containing protein [Escherichia coli]PSM34720.1 DNA-binding transcriptional regulator RamA [Escherichia coli]RIJ74382.1 helix-turn-helix domain-containing protein [Escherichia coli]RIX55949.1 helix-turn-helix domain-containing protein [Escherichia coli]
MFRTEGIIDEITQWIDSNLHKPLKIEDVAARAGCSKWHLQRIFVQVKEVSLGKYIKDKKLRLAAKDLIETNEPVINIAYKYGFDSQQTFTRVFSKKYKLPPLKYRNTERIRNMYLCSRFMAQSGRANKAEGPM